MSNNSIQDFIDEVKGALNKGSSGSGGGAQPDMNAAPGEPGHILNRTHWKETLPETVLADVKDYVFGAENSWMFTFPIGTELIEGAEITVSWNGTEYKCTVMATDVTGGRFSYFGNLGYIGFGFEDTGEPFYCIFVDGVTVFSCADQSSDFTVSFKITAKISVYHPIQKEYLGNAASVKYMLFTTNEDGEFTTSVTPDQVKEWIANDVIILAKYMSTTEDVHGNPTVISWHIVPMVQYSFFSPGVYLAFKGLADVHDINVYYDELRVTSLDGITFTEISHYSNA